MSDLDTLKHLVLAPYILKATALISVNRKVGGNQFRHSFATLGILLASRKLKWTKSGASIMKAIKL